MADTIFALSSGAPPAAIAVVRISGPHAGAALTALSGKLPKSRRATLAELQDPATRELLDRALILWFPGPGSATGEDVAELHLHGGRAVVAAVEGALAQLAGLRRAEAGEFTRRAFANGRLDLAEAEGLADLLAAETELQRRSALAMATGALSRDAQRWREEVLALSAAVEAVLDFADEDDAAALPLDFVLRLNDLVEELGTYLGQARAEVLHDGVKVAIAGPPNAGKSTLFNALIESESAITSPIAGTTRDVLTRAVAIEGVPLVFLDTAGLRGTTADPIERIGIDRARAAVEDADLVLWLGPEGEGPASAWEIAAKSDVPDQPAKHSARHRVSVKRGEGLAELREDIVNFACSALPKPGERALRDRQRLLLNDCRNALSDTASASDHLLAAEALRLARLALDRLLGRTGTEDMLDALFGRFCIGK